jgi:hypothetical protein
MLKALEKEKPTDEQLLSIKRENIEICYQGFLKGKQAIALMPYDAIATLALDGYCEFELYKSFLTHALNKCQKQLQTEIEDLKFKRRTAMAEEKEIEMTNLSVGDTIVEIMAKKMALVYFFSRAQEEKLENIYTKVDE